MCVFVSVCARTCLFVVCARECVRASLLMLLESVCH